MRAQLVSESNEFADYALVDHRNKPLGIVEAKRSSRNPMEGERQACDYADRILQQDGIDPFIFLANGNEIFFHDLARYIPFGESADSLPKTILSDCTFCGSTERP